MNARAAQYWQRVGDLNFEFNFLDELARIDRGGVGNDGGDDFGGKLIDADETKDVAKVIFLGRQRMLRRSALGEVVKRRVSVGAIVVDGYA